MTFELKLSQDLDPGPGEIPDGTRIPLTVESHSCGRYALACPDRLEGWKLRGRKRIFWVVFFQNKAVCVCFKRQWARDTIRDLKVQWVHES